MAPLGYAAKFEPFLSLDCTPPPLHFGAIKGKDGIKFCHLATLGDGVSGGSDKADNAVVEATEDIERTKRTIV